MKRLLGVCCVLAACTGDPGAPGQNGSNGSNGSNGTNGMNGMNGSNGNDIILTERAKHGLDISPAPLDLTGKTGDQIEQIGQGSYIVNAIAGCGDCHSNPASGPESPTNLLGGGVPFALDAATPPHMVYTRNLTPDPTHGLQLTEAEFIDTMRTGKDHTATANEALVVMPWLGFRWMSVSDLKAIYAYLKVIPPMTTANMADNKGPFASPPLPMPTTYNEGQASPGPTLPPEADAMGNPIPDPDHAVRGLFVQPFNSGGVIGFGNANLEAAFGRGSYLVNAVALCYECHTNPFRDFNPSSSTFLKINMAGYMAGGRVFGAPPGANALLHVNRSMSADLIGQTNGFFQGADYALFDLLISDGAHVDDPNPMPLAWPMPWFRFRQMTLNDLTAVYTYVSEIAANFPRTTTNDKATQGAAYYCAANADCDTANGETCNTTAHECIGRNCAADHECPACDTCTGGHCAAPASNSSCLTNGIP
jgi:hypothetical protein